MNAVFRIAPKPRDSIENWQNTLTAERWQSSGVSDSLTRYFDPPAIK